MSWRRWKLPVLWAVFAITLLAGQVASARVEAPQAIAEQIARTDAVVLAQWVSDQKGDDKQRGTTEYEIKHVVRNFNSGIMVGQRISIPLVRDGKAGDLSLILGEKTASGKEIEWGYRRSVSEAGFKYVAQMPSLDAPIDQRLEYYAKFLHSSDEFVARDAHQECEDAPFSAFKPLVEKMPRERIFQWLTSADTPAWRVGLYGRMIGICGNQEDAKYLEGKVLEQTQDFRIGIDGLMSGYLLLTREKGLAALDDAKLRHNDAPFSETYAAVQAIRFMWVYGEGKIKQERLLQSMRILLDKPDLADLAMNDLARWKDWSIQDQLMKMYGEGEFNNRFTKRAIVRYMLVSTKDLPKDATAGADAKVPEHVERGRRNLEELRQKDPKTVSEAERIFKP